MTVLSDLSSVNNKGHHLSTCFRERSYRRISWSGKIVCLCFTNITDICCDMTRLHLWFAWLHSTVCPVILERTLIFAIYVPPINQSTSLPASRSKNNSYISRACFTVETPSGKQRLIFVVFMLYQSSLSLLCLRDWITPTRGAGEALHIKNKHNSCLPVDRGAACGSDSGQKLWLLHGNMFPFVLIFIWKPLNHTGGLSALWPCTTSWNTFKSGWQTKPNKKIAGAVFPLICFKILAADKLHSCLTHKNCHYSSGISSFRAPHRLSARLKLRQKPW